ncbi:MAG: hypothetical protein DYG89_25235 [Caldilinea sp. CFX5]|nr:hypothetical protein [Caldilinea sp. CFX5]
MAFTPALPNLLSLIDGAQTKGLFTITGDPAVGIVTGEYQIKRQGEQVEVQMMPVGWQPNEHKWSVRLLYWLAADFTQWPQTYLWTAVLDLTDPQHVSMQASWQRIK